MKSRHCQWIESTIGAARDGNWSEELNAHAASCDSCRMARWMGGLAGAIESRSGALPDPELIWLKAKIKRRSQLPGRALLPLKAGGLLGAAGLGLLLAAIPQSAWHRIQAWRGSEAALGQLQDLLTVAAATSLWLPLAAVLLLLLAFTASEA